MATTIPRVARRGSTDSSARALRWRVIRDGAQSGARNMALDHALAATLRQDEGVLRLYAWERPTVSLGRNEPARALYTGRSGAAEAEVDWVRRPTGGRAVLHAQELTYAVIAPVDAWGGVRRAYEAIHLHLASALRALGASAAQVAPRATGNGGQGGRVLGPDAGPCFQAPAPGEIVAEGRKLVGSAQARLGNALLQHGSILLEDDQGRLDLLSGRGGSGSGPATLRELVGDVSIDDVARCVTERLREGFGGSWTEEGYRASEVEVAEGLEADRYGQDSWTWRR